MKCYVHLELFQIERKKERKKEMPHRLPNLCLKTRSLKSADFDCAVPLFTSKCSCFLSAVI